MLAVAAAIVLAAGLLAGCSLLPSRTAKPAEPMAFGTLRLQAATTAIRHPVLAESPEPSSEPVGVEELLSQPATRSASPARTVATRRDVTWRL